MLCEGSPLLFYTTSGPVTPPGMHHSQRGPAGLCPAACPAACAVAAGWGGSIASVLDNQPQLGVHFYSIQIARRRARWRPGGGGAL